MRAWAYLHSLQPETHTLINKVCFSQIQGVDIPMDRPRAKKVVHFGMHQILLPNAVMRSKGQSTLNHAVQVMKSHLISHQIVARPIEHCILETVILKLSRATTYPTYAWGKIWNHFYARISSIIRLGHITSIYTEDHSASMIQANRNSQFPVQLVLILPVEIKHANYKG